MKTATVLLATLVFLPAIPTRANTSNVSCGESLSRRGAHYEVGDHYVTRFGDDYRLPDLPPGLMWEYSHTEEGPLFGNVYVVVKVPKAPDQSALADLPQTEYRLGQWHVFPFPSDEMDKLPVLDTGLAWRYSHTEEGGSPGEPQFVYQIVAADR